MKILRTFFLTSILAILTLTAFPGCSTTRSEHGVQIEQKRSYNPLDYIPW